MGHVITASDISKAVAEQRVLVASASNSGNLKRLWARLEVNHLGLLFGWFEVEIGAATGIFASLDDAQTAYNCGSLE